MRDSDKFERFDKLIRRFTVLRLPLAALDHFA